MRYSPPHESFATPTDFAAHLLQALMALVSVIDAERPCVKGQVGLPEPWATERPPDPLPLPVGGGRPRVAGPSRCPAAPVLQDHRPRHELGVIACAGVPLATTTGIAWSLVLRATGEGIAAATGLLRRNDPCLGASQRKGLLNLLEWFGGQIVQLAGT